MYAKGGPILNELSAAFFFELLEALQGKPALKRFIYSEAGSIRLTLFGKIEKGAGTRATARNPAFISYLFAKKGKCDQFGGQHREMERIGKAYWRLN